MTKLKYKMRHGFRAAVSHFFRHRQHPVKMLDYTSKNLWLLLIPLTKYLIASRFDFQSWIRTNWVDILSISGVARLYRVLDSRLIYNGQSSRQTHAYGAAATGSRRTRDFSA